MSVVADSSAVVALLIADDPRHDAARAWYEHEPDDLVTTPLALAEMDYVLRRRAGDPGQAALWEALDSGALHVRWWADGARESLAIVRDHPAVGLADASLVALARLVRTDRIATFDTDFRSLTLPGGAPLILLPADA
ncbi:MAG TPA: PIN domain-containing protein [Baekduia sp.]|nr:PIN domain-containing protein [Baekduia sp.]